MEENPKAWPFKWKLRAEQYFSVILFINKNIMLNNVVPAFESVGCQWMKSYGEPLKQNHLSSTFTYNVHFVF